MGRVFMGSEFGANLGHIYPLVRVAKRLRELGHEVIFAVRDPIRAYEAIKDTGFTVLQAPFWQNPKIPGVEQLSTASYADVMFRQGFGDGDSLAGMLTAWDGLLNMVDPVLVIADHSPGINLAVRGRFPMITIGNGFTLPPPELDEFPSIIANSPPLVKQEALLGLFNGVLAKRGAPGLSRLPELFATEGHFVCTLPQLDPYWEYRQRPLAGPLEEVLAPIALPTNPRVFLYLPDEAVDSEIALEGLKMTGLPAAVYIPGASEQRREKYQSTTLQMLSKPVPLAQLLPEVSLVIHSGGSGIATACVLTGRPQILFPGQTEARLTARALSRQGIARIVPPKRSPEGFAKGLLINAHDSQMADRAFAISSELEKEDWRHALEEITSCAKELIN